MPGPGWRAREEHFRAETWSVTLSSGSGWVPGHEEVAGLAPGRDDPRGAQQALETQMGATLPLVSPSASHFPPGGCVLLKRF